MKWAQEQGLDYDEANWVESIVKAQVKNYQPEIIIISKQSTFSPGFVNNLRSEVPALRIVISWCGSPYKDISIFREYDFILSCIPELVEDFNAKGHLCYHLNHAFDPCVLDKIDTSSDASTDFSFIGSIVKVANSHIEREALLIELVEDTDLEIWSPLKISVNKATRIDPCKPVLSPYPGACCTDGAIERTTSKNCLVQEIPRYK